MQGTFEKSKKTKLEDESACAQGSHCILLISLPQTQNNEEPRFLKATKVRIVFGGKPFLLLLIMLLDDHEPHVA